MKNFFDIKALKSSEECDKFSKSVSYETLVGGTTTTGTGYKQIRRLSVCSADKPLSAVGTLTSLLCNSAEVVEKWLQISPVLRLVKIIILISVLSVGMVGESSADDEINCLTGQQSCGTNCCWSVENKKLTITGGKDGTVGTMDNYAWGSTGQNTQWPADITSIYVSGVENIGSEAFRNLNKVTNITIGESVERVGNKAFDNEYNLRYVDFGDAVTSIGSAVLQDSPRLIQIIVPDTLSDIVYQSLGNGDLVGRNIQIICRGDKVSCSNIYEKLSKYSSEKGQTYDATSQLFYANYEQCASTSYFWDGAKCMREPDISKRKCCTSCKDMGGWCNRIRYTPAEAAEVLKDDNNSVTITFKK